MAKIENTLPPILTGGTSIHNNLSGLNDGEYIHLNILEKNKFDNLPNSFAPVDAEKNVNTDWNATSGDEQLLNKPSTFPPSTHTHVEADITDLDKYTQLEVDNFLDDKVDKVTGKSLIDDTEITRLASVTNFDNSGNITALGNKVDKIVGKGLSEEDYTTVEKSKLSGIEIGAEVNNISDINVTDLTDGNDTALHHHDSRYYTETEVDDLISSKVEDVIVNGVTDKAPSQNKVFDALTLKVDKTTWTDYSATSTIGGFSSLSANILRYIEIDNFIYYYFNIGGVSNGATFTFTTHVPHAGGSYFAVGTYNVNNGIISNIPPRIAVISGSSTITILRDYSGTNWTTSGNKQVSGMIVMQKT